MYDKIFAFVGGSIVSYTIFDFNCKYNNYKNITRDIRNCKDLKQFEDINTRFENTTDLIFLSNIAEQLNNKHSELLKNKHD